MTVTPVHKTPRGYELQPTLHFLRVDDGIQPKLPKGEAATFLPVVLQDKYVDEWIIVQAGQFGARHSSGQLIYCNGGTAVTPLYGADDVDYTVDLDDGSLNSTSARLVAEAAHASTQLAANFPIGIAFYNWYSGSIRIRHSKKNYELQPDVAVMNRGHFEMPMFRTNQNTLDEGDLIASDADGWPKEWSGDLADVAQIAGRCLWVDAITSYPGVTELAKVRTVKNVNLAGANTSGQPTHLYKVTHEAGGVATNFMRINLTLL